MIFRQIGHELRGESDLVEGIVPSLLLAKHGAESEVQGGIFRIGVYGLAQVEFSLVKTLRGSIAGGTHQWCGDLGCGLSAGGCFAGCRFAAGKRANQVGIGAGSFELMNLFFAGNIRESALLNQTDEAAARHAGH